MNPWSVGVPASRRRRFPLRRAAASAPMRVSLAGGGTDVPPFVLGLGGRVVGTAIELRVRAVAEPFDRGWLRFEACGGVASEAAPGERAIVRRRGEAPRAEIAFRLLEAAIAALGVEDGVNLEVHAEIGPGAGLGGSAAAAVATLGALRASLGDEPDPRELASEAIALERDRLALPCGSQDQLFAALGGLLDMRYDDRGRVQVDALEPPDALVDRLESGLLLVDTRSRRVSGEVLARLGTRVDDGTAAELVRAAGDVARGLALGSLDVVLGGMRRNAAAKLRRDPAGNELAIAMTHRLEGSGADVVRTCGAGGGGHVLVWARRERHQAIADALAPCPVRRPAIRARGLRIDPA